MNVCISITLQINRLCQSYASTQLVKCHTSLYIIQFFCIYQYCLYKNGNAQDSNLNSGFMFFDAAQSKEKKTNKQQ